MNKNKAAFFVAVAGFVLVSLSSCQAFFEWFFNSRPNNSYFQYYSQTPPEISEKLSLTGIYHHDDSNGVKTYMAFYPDGFVSYFSNTGIEPDIVKQNPAFVRVQRRRRNGQPKELTNDFGYFQTANDSLFLTIDDLGVLGSRNLQRFKGQIYPDSLVLFHDQPPVTSTQSYYGFGTEVFYLIEPQK